MQIDTKQLLDGLIKAYKPNQRTPRIAPDLFSSIHSQASPAAPTPAILHWHETTLKWLEETKDSPRAVLFPDSVDYPSALTDLRKPPLVLFCEGNLSALHAPSLAMVGSRNASRTGLDLARSFAQDMANKGWTIVSGLAEGIDGAAHEGCLDGNGLTVAVLGGATDRIYPKSHHGLADRILQNGGVIVSEYPPGTDPRPLFFPQRNRIIAALSTGVLVVEAASRSGSLITARQASEIGRAVMALPGSVHSAHSKGCHEMIKQGAMLVETSGEIEAELRAILPPEKTSQLVGKKQPCSQAKDDDKSPEKYPLTTFMSYHPEHVDDLANRSGMSAEEVLASLTEMELEGLVCCEAGNRWLLRSAA